MQIAKTQNLNLVRVTVDRLLNRVDGLPGLAVLYAPSGYGKTTATVAITQEVGGHYVQMRSAWTKKAFVEKLCFEMALEKPKKLVDGIDMVCEYLATSQRPLIVDEADYAVVREGMVEILRDIYEGSQAPLLLVGEEQLPNKLKRYERFHGRVLSWIPAQPVSLKDAQELARIYAPAVTIAKAVLEYLVESSHGSIRRVTVNLVNLAEEANLKGIDTIDLKTLDKKMVYTGEAPKRVIGR